MGGCKKKFTSMYFRMCRRGTTLWWLENKCETYPGKNWKEL